MMNDDVVIAPDTANLMAEAILDKQFHEERPAMDRMVLLVSAWNVRDYERGTIESPPRYTSHDFVEDFKSTEDPYSRRFKPRWGTGPDYSCFMFGKALFEQVGRFDETFPVYFEDNDSHYRIGMSGYEALSFAPYYHYGSQTINSSPEMQEFGRLRFERSRDIYIQKWGGMPGQETFRSAWNK
jgi:GT2 family glycosyltransferase